MPHKLDSQSKILDQLNTITSSKLGNLETLLINNDHASATVSLFGGQVLSFIPQSDNRNRLWLSKKAILDGTKAIRGGIPICWPWFGNDHHFEHDNVPAHGFVRTQDWCLVYAEESTQETRIVLKPQTTRQSYYDFDVDLSLTISIGASMKLELRTRNNGISPIPLTYAMHTYFEVSDIEQIEIKGLLGKYKDKTKNWETGDTPKNYTVFGETDRIHDAAPCRLTAIDRSNAGEQISFESHGHDSIVVWNPGKALSASMIDMDGSGYKTMLCIENAKLKSRLLAPCAEEVLIKIIE